MKKIILAVALLALAFSFTTAQKGQVVSRDATKREVAPRRTPIKHVQVTAQTIAGQPASKAYVLDLTRRGKIYNLAADIDYSRVRARTSKGEIAVADLVKGFGKGSKLLVGRLSDIRVQGVIGPAGGGVVAKYTCEGALCTCTGDDDCNDMFTNAGCGDIASCDTGTDSCQCLKAPF